MTKFVTIQNNSDTAISVNKYREYSSKTIDAGASATFSIDPVIWYETSPQLAHYQAYSSLAGVVVTSSEVSTATVSILVVDSTGVAVAGVSVASAGLPTKVSDANGVVEYTAVPVGAHTFALSKTGHTTVNIATTVDTLISDLYVRTCILVV